MTTREGNPFTVTDDATALVFNPACMMLAPRRTLTALIGQERLRPAPPDGHVEAFPL